MSQIIWKKLDMNWPIICNGKEVGLSTLKKEMLEFLKSNDILPVSFSHFGVVVKSIDSYMEWLQEVIGRKIQTSIIMNRVDSYNVHVARFRLDDYEMELIEPFGESFFMDYNVSHGDYLHHISFQVKDAEDGLSKLSYSKDAIELIDKKPRIGSHGKVAFIRPAFAEPLCLELCQYTK